MRRLKYLYLSLALIAGTTFALTSTAFADTCGSGDQAIQTSIEFGCTGNGPSAIADLLFAIIRFLTAGVGIVLIVSTIVAGIQYTTSRGDPNLVAKSKDRLRANAIALLFFIFGFALLNYIVPGQILQ